ncbi:MAG: thioredoxin domain-containing protein [Nanoarchaeota archaeon]|nr:thioredoxin domain-containing protein [Nanoarchaeota archaeon]
MSEKAVTEKVINFLNSQVDGEVSLDSISRKGSYYELIVFYQGDRIPLQVTLDGENLISDLVPIDIGFGGNTGNTNIGNTNAVGTVDINIEGAYFKGNENAPVTIVEFSDFECPFCKGFYSDTLPLIEENYINKGKVKLVYMHFPLTNIHSNAQEAAEASECAGEQGKFWEMHDKIFENQEIMSVSNYKIWAKSFDLNSEEFDSCLDDGKYEDKVQEQLAYGSSLGVTGTPGFFINGKPLSGAQPFSAFEQIIEAELA